MPLSLVALALLVPALVARRAAGTRHGAAFLGITAVALAMYAGTQVASHLAYGDGHWKLGLEAIVVAMICGSTLALHYFERRSHPDAGGADTLDATIEMEVRAQPAPMPRLNGRSRPPAWAWGASLATAAALAVIASWLTVSGRPAGPLGDDTAPPALAVYADESPARTDAVGADAVAERPASGAPDADIRAASTQSVKHSVVPSIARRECLGQVESARLFMTIARSARTASDYTRLTNPEIKRLAASTPVGPRTLQSIAQRVWYSRNESDRAAAWWTRQYAQCEETRMDGGAYVVSR